MLNNIPKNRGSKEREQVQPATETPVLQKCIQANAAIKTIAAMSLEQFWAANPELAVNKNAFLQTFEVLGNHVAQTQNHDQQLEAERLAALDEEALIELAKIEEQKAMILQQEKEKTRGGSKTTARCSLAAARSAKTAAAASGCRTR